MCISLQNPQGLQPENMSQVQTWQTWISTKQISTKHESVQTTNSSYLAPAACVATHVCWWASHSLMPSAHFLYCDFIVVFTLLHSQEGCQLFIVLLQQCSHPITLMLTLLAQPARWKILIFHQLIIISAKKQLSSHLPYFTPQIHIIDHRTSHSQLRELTWLLYSKCTI